MPLHSISLCRQTTETSANYNACVFAPFLSKSGKLALHYYYYYYYVSSIGNQLTGKREKVTVQGCVPMCTPINMQISSCQLSTHTSFAAKWWQFNFRLLLKQKRWWWRIFVERILLILGGGGRGVHQQIQLLITLSSSVCECVIVNRKRACRPCFCSSERKIPKHCPTFFETKS